jgi:hypothetical protein
MEEVLIQSVGLVCQAATAPPVVSTSMETATRFMVVSFYVHFLLMDTCLELRLQRCLPLLLPSKLRLFCSLPPG